MLGLALFGSPAAAQDGQLTVELNKLEAGENGNCRAFFLFRNNSPASLEGFEMSLAILNTSGVISQLLTVDASPLPVTRTSLKLFELPETRCDDVAEILLHDVGVCRPANSEDVDCFAFMTLTSKASAPLTK